MKTAAKHALAFAAVALLARDASASYLTCQKTVNDLPSVTIEQYPASLQYDLTITEATCARCATLPENHWCHQPGGCGTSVVKAESDAVLEAMLGAPISWTFPPWLPPEYQKFSFWLQNGASLTTSVPLGLASYADCATKARAAGFVPDAGGRILITNTFRVTWNPDGAPPGYAECTADVTCEPPLGPTRTIGYFRTHPDAVAACVAAAPIDLGFYTVAQGDTAAALGVLGANPARYDDGVKRSSLDQARVIVARQLVAAICNGRVFGSAPASTLLTDAIGALAGGTCANLSWLAGQLDAFNNSGDTGENPFGSASPGSYADPTPRTTGTCR